MLSRSSSKHSYIPGAYLRKHLLIPCPTNTIVGHILAIVSNKHTRVSLDQGANWFGAPATNVRRVSEANRMFNRTNPPIVAKIKDCENCTHAKFAQFSNNWQRFFPTQRVDASCQLLTHVYRKLIWSGTRHTRAAALAFLETTLPRRGRPSSLQISSVSIVLIKLAIANLC